MSSDGAEPGALRREPSAAPRGSGALTSSLDAERFRLAFEDSAIGMAIEGLDGRLLQVNPALCGMLNYTAEQMLAMSYQDLCHPDDLEGPAYLESLSDGSVRRVTRECRYLRADRTVIWVRVHIGVIHDDGQARFYTAQIEDITAAKDAEAMLTHQAEHDALTGLPNRATFARQVTAALERGERPALLFVDLDRFKLVNDTLGHPAGDELLIAVGERLRGSMRDEDVIARIGGDEFVVLARATSLTEAKQVAARLQAALTAPFQVSGRALVLTASIGIALTGGAVSSAEDTLRAADLAMYRAKTTGKDRAVVFDVSMRRDAERRLIVEQDLRRAIATPGEISVWFQPVVSVATGRVVSAEGQLRWHHARREQLASGELERVAEETGLIAVVGRAGLVEALGHARSWREQGARMVVSVNLSARQLDDSGLPRDVAALLREFDLEPTDLCLEVTETVLVEASGCGGQTVQELRALGVAVAIDEFGKGYSSLSYLRAYPVDIIKLDRAFVATLETNPRDAAIVGGIIQLGHALGMTCVAEGVERPEQLRHLTDLGCDQIQGLLLAPPCPPDELMTHLEASPRGGAPRLAGLARPSRLPG